MQGNTIRWRIGFEMYKNTDLLENGKEYIGQIKKMLDQIGIKTSPVRLGSTTIRKDGTKSKGIKIEIEHKEFEKFYKQICFDDKNKTKKLEYAIAGKQAVGPLSGGIRNRTPEPSGLRRPPAVNCCEEPKIWR